MTNIIDNLVAEKLAYRQRLLNELLEKHSLQGKTKEELDAAGLIITEDIKEIAPTDHFSMTEKITYTLAKIQGSISGELKTGVSMNEIIKGKEEVEHDIQQE